MKKSGFAVTTKDNRTFAVEAMDSDDNGKLPRTSGSGATRVNWSEDQEAIQKLADRYNGKTTEKGVKK